MKVSLNWARKFTKIDLPTEELVKLATERLGGIEGYEDLGKHYDGIIVAKVISCVKHSNADKLNVCKVDDGGVVKDVARDEDGYVQVVCGAANVREGILVAWIPPTAIVPASYGDKKLFVLEARDLRGELSNGMLASPRELGISEDHEGILEIDPITPLSSVRHSERSESGVEEPRSFDDAQDDGTVKLGTPFKELYDLDDTIIEIENKMFTHRPDGFGQLGVARELAGIQHQQFKSPDWYLRPVLPTDDSPNISVAIEDPEMSPRYMAVEFENVQIKQSPIWLQSYLKRVGIRPINIIVDITNYIMVETAQPLHAFDFDKVSENGKVNITVRRPHENEKLLLLDGKEIQPHKDATLICSTKGPIALGGVMGGGGSEIDQNTTHVVLECATFNMYNVRKTSMIHGLFTDAATRLTKGQPAEQLPSVLAKAIEMLEELAGAKLVGGVADNYPTQRKNKPNYIEVSSKFINERLGSKFTNDKIIKLLSNVEFEAHVASGPISVTPPFWRTDIEIPEDIVEEVGRLYGFNQLEVKLPMRSITPAQLEPRLTLKQQIRTILSRAGANEVLTHSFVHGDLLKKAGQKTEDSYALRNALSPDLQYYRQSLTPSLLELVHSNIKAGYDAFALFELNKAHNKIHGEDEDGLPGELNFVTLTYASKKQAEPAYYNAKRYLDYLAKSLGFTLTYTKLKKDPGFPVTSSFEPSRSAFVTIKEGDVFLGIIGEYKAEVIKSLKLPEASAGFEVGLDALVQAVNYDTTGGYAPLSKYPSTEQDLTLKVKQTISVAELEGCVQVQLEGTDYQWKLAVTSIYQKEGDENKNITFRITLAHHDRTLTTAEVNKLVETISWQAHKELQAEQI